MERAKKPKVVDVLSQVLMDSSMLVVTSQTGLTVAQSNDLRDKVRDAGASFRVTKNTLMKIALKGTDAETLSHLFKGPTGLVAGSDPVGVAKAVADFAAKNDKLTVVAGLMNGRFISADQVKALSKLPSLNELRGSIVGLIIAPATKIAGVLQAPAGQLARLMAAKSKKES
jgi:large subunit ribosomal protein L10